MCHYLSIFEIFSLKMKRGKVWMLSHKFSVRDVGRSENLEGRVVIYGHDLPSPWLRYV